MRKIAAAVEGQAVCCRVGLRPLKQPFKKTLGFVVLDLGRYIYSCCSTHFFRHFLRVFVLFFYYHNHKKFW